MVSNSVNEPTAQKTKIFDEKIILLCKGRKGSYILPDKYLLAPKKAPMSFVKKVLINVSFL